MEAVRDLFVVILLVIALGIAWVATGGPDRISGTPEPFIRSPLLSRDFVPRVNLYSGATTADDTSDIEYTSFGEASPFANAIEFIHPRSGPRTSDPSEEYVSIRANRRNSGPVNISGWKLQSPVTKRIYTIPGAAELPRSGTTNLETSVLMSPGETVIITTGRSPIGSSFRTNICTGYFEQFQEFTPRLDERCPYPEDDLGPITADIIRNFGSDCIDLIEDLPRCEMYIQPIPSHYPYMCNEFITTHINYTGCINNHKDDADFYRGEWRLFLGSSREAWSNKREIINLIDAQGKIVDTVSY